MSFPAPSPTRSMIKEANDHLHLLHQRVNELERTVQEQAQALIRKDEEMQAKVQEVVQSKDAVINNLTETVQDLRHRLASLQQQCHEKDLRLASFSPQQQLLTEIVSYTPALSRLLTALNKLPAQSQLKASRSAQDGLTDGVESYTQQPERKLNRSFKINSNFSMSEDETEDEF